MDPGNAHLLAPEDDDFHAPSTTTTPSGVRPGSSFDEAWWFHETCWFWFFVPERKLGGWLYNWVRPNIGVSGGGCWVWDDTTFLHMEVPYYANYSNQLLPEKRDLRDFTYPSGVSVKMLEPLKRYRLGFRDRDWIHLDLEYDAIMEPWVSLRGDPPTPQHLDQVGRVTGELVLYGDKLDVDCLAIRDRTWSRRAERYREGGGGGYTNAAAGPDLLFLHGRYFIADGVRAELVESERTVERDPEHGYITRIAVRGKDTEGRTLEAEGRSLSRMAMPIPGVHGVVWTSLVDWTINGVQAWGEDQEPWPLTSWAAFRREQREPGKASSS